MRLQAHQPLPEIKPTCLGCRTFFTLNQHLSNLTPSYFDMIQLPIKKMKQRIELLRMICAFLSSKGGHIYLGIQRKNIQVKGIQITTKQQDEFKFYVKQLLGKIHPKVDLSNKEEVETVFIPVLTEGKEATGRTVIKIIVKQGQKDRVYTYVQKVKVTNPKGGEPEEFELRYGFVMEGNQYLRLEGTKLIDEISNKAKNPMEKCRFHEGCNPKPFQVDPSVKLITFQGFTSSKDQNGLLNLLKVNLSEDDIQFDHRYNEKDKVLILQFHTQADTITVQKLINTNLPQLKQTGVKITFQGSQFNTFVYKKSLEIVQEKVVEQKEVKEQDKKSKPNKILFGVSNYKIAKKDEFMRLLKQHLPQNFHFGVRFFTHSVILELKSEEQVRIIKSTISNFDNIKNYTNAFNDGQLSYGKITGHIIVYGIHEKSRDFFRQYAMRQFNDKLQKVEFQNQKGRLVIDLKFSIKDVNDSLDRLIGQSDKELKSMGKENKMGYCLGCE